MLQVADQYLWDIRRDNATNPPFRSVCVSLQANTYIAPSSINNSAGSAIIANNSKTHKEDKQQIKRIPEYL